MLKMLVPVLCASLVCAGAAGAGAASPTPTAAEEAAWGKGAAALYQPPVVMHDALGQLGGFGAGTVAKARAYLAGGMCVKLDANGVPVVQYQRAGCHVDDVPWRPEYNPGTVAAFALGLWTIGGHESQFLAQAKWLLAHQSPDGTLKVAFPIPMLGLKAGWVSAMYQGQAVSTFLRAYEDTRDTRYMEAATKALAVLEAPESAGGTTYITPLSPWPEEYAAPDPPSVLNGALTAITGVWEYQTFTGEPQPMLAAYQRTLDAMLPLLTVPGWAKYEIAGSDMASLGYMGVQTGELFTFAQETGDQTALLYGRLWLSDFEGDAAATAALVRSYAGIVPSGEIP